eukprot:jgi/Bigna1/87954/estExt_fgenesh1_pg.C_260080
MIRLLGLDQNDNYRILYVNIREIETEILNLQMRLSEDRRQQQELQMAISQCKSAADLVDRWIIIKDELKKIEAELPNAGNGLAAAKIRQKALKDHEKEVAEALRQHFSRDKSDTSNWLDRDRDSLVSLQITINQRQGQLLAAYETCTERCRKSEMMLVQHQNRRNEQDGAIVGIVDAAYQRISATLHPDRVQNPSDQTHRRWNEVQQAYRILRNVQLHRKFVSSDSEAEFFREMARLQIGFVESEKAESQDSQLHSYAARPEPPSQCRMPVVIEESSDSTSRLTTVTMQWRCENGEKGVTEYQLQSKGSQSNDFEVVYEGKGSDCILDLLPDEYVFRVRARNSAGTGSFSPELVYAAHDAPEKKKSMTMQKMYRKELMVNEACRNAEQLLANIVKDMIENGSNAAKVEELASALNVGRKNKLDLGSQELYKRGTNLLKSAWQIPDTKVQRSQWGIKFSSLVKELLSQKSSDSFQKLVRSEVWSSFDQEVLCTGFNYLVILALRALRLNYPPVVVDGSLRVLHAALQTKAQPSNPYWVRRIQTLFELLRKKLQQQWNQAKSKGASKETTRTEEQRKIQERRQEELEKKKVKEKREAERQAARLREQKRKALHEKLWRQQVAQGKVQPKTTRSTPTKQTVTAPVKPAPKFRCYPKHHQQGKFQLCKFWLVGQSCRKQPCWFAHGKEELADWYRQREDEQVKKKGGHKKPSDGSSSPSEAPAKAATASSDASESPPKAKETPKMRPTKATPAPVVKSVWQKNAAKKTVEQPSQSTQKLLGDMDLEALEKKMSGMWQGKSTMGKTNVMIWQSCNLNFNLQQRGKFIGSCICVWNRETLSFKIEGQLRFPEVTLVRKAAGNSTNHEFFKMRIEQVGNQLSMSGASSQSRLSLIRTPAKDKKPGKMLPTLPKKSIADLLPSPAADVPIATQRSASVDSFAYGASSRLDSFGAPGVASLLEDRGKSSPGLFSFGMLGSAKTSKNNSPATIGPGVGQTPSPSSEQPAADAKGPSPLLPRPVGGIGTMFNSQFGGSKVWGSLNASKSQEYNSSETKLKLSSNPITATSTTSHIGSSAVGAGTSGAPGTNSFSSYLLPNSSKSVGGGGFRFSSGISNGHVGFGSLFSSMSTSSSTDSKWNMSNATSPVLDTTNATTPSSEIRKPSAVEQLNSSSQKMELPLRQGGMKTGKDYKATGVDEMNVGWCSFQVPFEAVE